MIPSWQRRDESGSGRTLVLVKHATPVIEPYAPSSTWRLSEEGRRQSIDLAERLQDYALERVVTSEEPKAIETAEVVAEYLGLPWAVAPGLHEHDRTGAAFGTREEFESAARDFFDNPQTLVWGNETAEQARTRFASGVHAALAQHPGSNVAVVAHGTVITLFLTNHSDIDAYGFWSGLGLPSFCVMSLLGFRLQKAVFDVGV